MATMSGTAMATSSAKHSMSTFFGNRSQLSLSGSQLRLSSFRSERSCQVGSARAFGSQLQRPGGFSSGPSSSSRIFGTNLRRRFYGEEVLGLGTFSKSRQSSRAVVAQAGKDGIQAPERILAALGYVLPFFDGIQYGRYFFLQYPVAESLLRPLYPLLAAYKGFPYSNFIAFFGLYLLVVRNPSISRYVRFNAMQAVVLDVLLILPTLVERTFAPRGGWGFELLIIFYNTVFLFLVACFLFGVVSCILGKTPRLPIVADAADAQV
jgi:uncharacterized membrane protein